MIILKKIIDGYIGYKKWGLDNAISALNDSKYVFSDDCGEILFETYKDDYDCQFKNIDCFHIIDETELESLKEKYLSQLKDFKLISTYNKMIRLKNQFYKLKSKIMKSQNA